MGDITVHAELTVRTLRPLPGELEAALSSRWGPSFDKATALSITYLRSNASYLPQIRHAQFSQEKIVLVFSLDRQKLTLHIEANENKDDIRSLKEVIEDTRDDILGFLLSHWNVPLAQRATILSGQSAVLRGTSNSPGRILKRYMRQDMFRTMLFFAAVYLITLLRGLGKDQAESNLVVALIVAGIVFLIDLIFSDRKLQYEE